MTISDEKNIPLNTSTKKTIRPDLPLLVLIAANAVPIIGVVYFKWQVLHILPFYWSENLAIGFYTVLKMVFMKVKDPAENRQKLYMVPSFVLLYCCYTMIFVVMFCTIIFLPLLGAAGGWIILLPFALPEMIEKMVPNITKIIPGKFLIVVLVWFISHGVSFAVNYLHKGEYSRTNLQALMFQPYRRVFIMHIVVLIGGIILQFIFFQNAFIVVLIGLKTLIDIRLHNSEHKKMALV